MRRGEIYFAALDPTVGAEVQKTRPVVVVSNNAANRAASVVTVVPLTSNVARVFPFEVLLPAARTGLAKDSKVGAAVSRIHLTEDCEIIECSAEAEASIRGIADDDAK